MSTSQGCKNTKSPLRFAGGGFFFISAIEMFNCMCIDLMRAEEISMNRIAFTATCGAFGERVDDAVRAGAAAVREARDS